MKKLIISEVFYSIQGEGKTVGVPSVFVRLGGCNLICGGMGTQFDKELHNGAEWRCDTVEVWMNGGAVAVEDVLHQDCIEAIEKGAHIVLTGGEPMMQQPALEEFINYIKDEIVEEPYIEVETNGTIMPSDFLLEEVKLWNCSPKLSNSGNDKALAYKPEVIEVLNNFHTIFKFVVNTKKEWHEIGYLYMPIIDRDKVYLMPAGENQILLKKNKNIVAEICKENNVKYSTRLHIEIWNKKTGV